MVNLSRLIWDIHADLATESEEKASADQWAIVGSRFGWTMRRHLGQWWADDFVSAGKEKKFLKLLPPETELVAGGITVDERLRELEQHFALLLSLKLRMRDALTLPPEEKQQFFVWLNTRAEEKR